MHGIGIESVKGLGAYFRSLVHVSVEDDAVASARHQSFIASHVLAGFVALLVFPIYLVVGGKPTLLGAIAFLWLLSPIGLAIFLSRTGKFAAAHLISAANFAGLVTFFWFGSNQLGAIIGAAMVINLLAAAIAGIFIPLALQRWGFDPAVSSTVYVTTATVVVGFFAFLGLASLWLT